jgi:RHS repeat-associated protein
VLRYATYCYDGESGLYYLSARHYDPATGQFLSKDPAKADGEESAYQYCEGEPVGTLDSTSLHASKSITYETSPWGAYMRLRLTVEWNQVRVKGLFYYGVQLTKMKVQATRLTAVHRLDDEYLSYRLPYLGTTDHDGKAYRHAPGYIGENLRVPDSGRPTSGTTYVRTPIASRNYYVVATDYSNLTFGAAVWYRDGFSQAERAVTLRWVWWYQYPYQRPSDG